MPQALACFRASRMRVALMMGTPSSESAAAPAVFKAAKSFNFSPFCPAVTAVMGRTRTPDPTVSARSSTYCTSSGVSTTGLVLGIQAMAVKPPAAAAAVPVWMSSFSVCPGSRR